MKECRFLCWLHNLDTAEQNLIWRVAALLAHGGPEVKAVILGEVRVLEASLQHSEPEPGSNLPAGSGVTGKER